MDCAKQLAQAVVAAGLIFMWPGPWVASLVTTHGTASHVGASATGTPSGATVAAYMLPDAKSAGSRWFRRVQPSCNPVQVDVRLRDEPAPDDVDGRAWEATCRALAGQVDQARGLIEAMPQAARRRAAGVVFEQAHPVADAGDDLAAGPIMELVVEFWPNHYMALYHAGAARYDRGDYPAARGYLARFLQQYHVQDGWTNSALVMLRKMGDSTAG